MIWNLKETNMFFPPAWVGRDLSYLPDSTGHLLGWATSPGNSNTHSHSLLHNSGVPLEKAVPSLSPTTQPLAGKVWPKVNFQIVRGNTRL